MSRTCRFDSLNCRVPFALVSNYDKSNMAQVPYRQLEERARDYDQCREYLEEKGQWQNALEQAHFSVEIAMKRAVAKSGYMPYPVGSRGHDLKVIALCRVRLNRHSISIERAAKTDPSIADAFSEILSADLAWNMHMRYECIAPKPELAGCLEDLIENYRKLYKWTMNKFD